MLEKLIFIICCCLTNISYICGDNIFVKKGNSYEFITGDKLFAHTLTSSYVLATDNSIQDFKTGKIPVEGLNNFNEGFQKYYSFRGYEKEDVDVAYQITHTKVLPDRITLPEFQVDKIKFKNNQVFGFSPKKSKSNYNSSSVEEIFMMTYSTKSDFIIFTSEFELNNSTFFLVYPLKTNKVEMNYNTIRSGVPAWYMKISLSFLTEELLHTYDSSYDRYAEANETINKEFSEVLRNTFLPSIMTFMMQDIIPTFAEYDAEYTSSYQKTVLSTLVKSAHHYLAAKGINNFEATPMNFTNAAGTHVYLQSYKDIKVEGLLNYVKFQLINSTTESFANDTETNRFSDAVLFTYPEEGEKQAFVSFVVSDGRHENRKKFKVKGIQFITVYDVSVKIALKVTRVKDYFHNGSGFLIKFELDGFDPIYEFLVRHIGNDIARAVDQALADKVQS